MVVKARQSKEDEKEINLLSTILKNNLNQIATAQETINLVYNYYAFAPFYVLKFLQYFCGECGDEFIEAIDYFNEQNIINEVRLRLYKIFLMLVRKLHCAFTKLNLC